MDGYAMSAGVSTARRGREWRQVLAAAGDLHDLAGRIR